MLADVSSAEELLHATNAARDATAPATIRIRQVRRGRPEVGRKPPNFISFSRAKSAEFDFNSRSAPCSSGVAMQKESIFPALSAHVGRSLLLCASLVAVAPTSAAAPAKKPAKAQASTFDAAGVAAKLTSRDAAEVTAGLKLARLAGKEAAPVAPLIERLLDRGLPTDLAKSAIETAGDVGQPSSSATLAHWAKNRDAELRRVAVLALLKTRGPAAVKALRGALSDADGRVRGTAASGLGALGAREALPELDAALERKVGEAAAAIGQLCKDDECERFAARTGRVPFDVMTSGFDQILFRSDVSDDAKIKLVGRIRELGTGEAHRFLRDVLGRWGSGSAKVKSALEQAAAATQGSPSDKPAAGGGS